MGLARAASRDKDTQRGWWRGTFCAALLGLVVVGVVSKSVAAQDLSEPSGRGLVLSLSEAVTLAVRNNLDLRAALLDEQIERERIREALGAFDPELFADISGGRRESLFAANFPLDPANPMSPTVTRIISQVDDVGDLNVGVRGVLDTGMSYELTFNSNYRRIDEGGDFNPIFTNSTRLSFTQPLLRSAWSTYQEAPVEQARISTLDSREAYRMAVRDKVGQIEQAYFDHVFAVEDREVKRQSLILADQQLELTRLRVETGALAEIEITSAEAGQASRRADLVTAESQVVEAEDRLRRLILAFDRSSDWEVHIEPSERPGENFSELKPTADILRLAERSHPELLRAHLSLAQARVDLRLRESERDPRFDVTGSLSMVGLQDEFGTALENSFQGNKGATSWNLGLAFAYPLGNRAADSRVAQSMLSLRKAALALQDTRTEMIFQVRNALRKIDVARRSIAARKEAQRLAREQLDNERLRLELKRSTNFQVFQVEDDLNQRTTELIRALIDYRLAVLELSRVTGARLESLVQAP